MAFGSGSSNVARADVEFRAETGKFEADVTQAKRIYTDSVDQMSTATLRMSVAQEKLDRAISKFGPESVQARQAAIFYRKELNAVQEQADHTTRSVRRNHNEMVRAGRGAIAASGAFKGLGNALFFASSSFAGAFGIIYALRSTIKAAQVAQVSMTRLSVAVKNAGFAWQDHRKEIIDTIEAQSKLTSFDDEELQDSFGRAIIRTKDLSEAFRLNGVAADYARASGRSLEQSMTLVLRASLGQTASLKRLGIESEKVTTNTDKLRAAGVKVTFEQRQEAKALDAKATKLKIIAALEAKLAGQSGEFAKTAQGRQERFNKVLEDTQEIIGLALLPTFTDLLTRFSEYLDKVNKSGEIQRKMNTALDGATLAVKGIAEALKIVAFFGKPVVDLLGGIENAVKTITLLWVGFKVKALLSFTATALASRGTATKMVADAAVAGRAWDVATRPRAMSVTTTTTGGFGGVRFGGGANIAIILAALFGPDFVRKLQEEQSKGEKGIGRFFPDFQLYPGGPSVRDLLGGEGKRGEGEKGAKGEAPRSSRGGSLRGPALEAEEARQRQRKAAAERRRARPPRTEVDIQLDLARARARGDVSAEARADRELLALYKAQAANLDRRKNRTLLQKQRLEQLYGQIASVQSELDGIAAEAARKDQERARTAEQEKAKQRAARKQRLDTREQQLENQLLRAAASKQLKDDGEAARALIAFYRNAAKNQALTAKERAQYENKKLKVVDTLRTARSAATVKRLDLKERRLENAADRAELTETLADDRKRLKTLIAFYREMANNDNLSAKARADYEKKRIAARKRLQDVNKQDAKDGLTAEQVRSMQFEFLTKLTGEIGQYGSNFQSDSGQIATQAHVQTSLLRDQNAALHRLIEGAWHPGSQLASAELSGAGWGVGF